MSASKVWWFRVRLCAAFPLLVAAAFLIAPYGEVYLLPVEKRTAVKITIEGSAR